MIWGTQLTFQEIRKSKCNIVKGQRIFTNKYKIIKLFIRNGHLSSISVITWTGCCKNGTVSCYFLLVCSCGSIISFRFPTLKSIFCSHHGNWPSLQIERPKLSYDLVCPLNCFKMSFWSRHFVCLFSGPWPGGGGGAGGVMHHPKSAKRSTFLLQNRLKIGF